MKEITRDKRRIGLIGRFFFASHPFDPATAPAFFRFVTYGGALIGIMGAAAIMGRRDGNA